MKDTLKQVRGRLIGELKSYRQTVNRMFAIAREYASDLAPFADYSIYDFYNLVRALPYRADPEGVETIIRPKYTVRADWPLWRDCDDKTILIVAFAFMKGYETRLACVGTRDYIHKAGGGWKPAGPHHVYPEIKIAGDWIPFDATYNDRCILGGRLYNERFRTVHYYGTPVA